MPQSHLGLRATCDNLASLLLTLAPYCALTLLGIAVEDVAKQDKEQGSEGSRVFQGEFTVLSSAIESAID